MGAKGQRQMLDGPEERKIYRFQFKKRQECDLYAKKATVPFGGGEARGEERGKRGGKKMTFLFIWREMILSSHPLAREME